MSSLSSSLAAGNTILADVVQIFNRFEQLLFCSLYSFLSSNDGNEFLVFVFSSRKYNPRTSVFAHFTNGHTTTANKEAMVFWLCTNFSSVTTDFLFTSKLQQLFLGLLDIVFWTTNQN